MANRLTNGRPKIPGYAPVCTLYYPSFILVSKIHFMLKVLRPLTEVLMSEMNIVK